MRKFIHCKTKRDFTDAAGHDWAKIVKVDGGYIGFETITDWKIWKMQK